MKFFFYKGTNHASGYKGGVSSIIVKQQNWTMSTFEPFPFFACV